MVDPRRSGIGRFSQRTDLAALAIVFSFGALLNAFGMVSPVYALESWLAGILHLNSKAPVLGVLFAFFLVVEPAALLGMAAWLTQIWGGSRRALVPLAVRYTYGLVPLGFGMWLAHYSFHFMTGLYTVVPITQSAAARLGWTGFGSPRWDWLGIPMRFVQPLEIGFLVLGLAGSLLVIHQLAEGDCAERPLRAFAPWAAVAAVLWVAAMWMMFQPMDMRGTFLAG